MQDPRIKCEELELNLIKLANALSKTVEEFTTNVNWILEVLRNGNE